MPKYLRLVEPWSVTKASQRVNIVLDDERAVKLRRLAERTHTTPGTLARSLLSTALAEADPDPRTIVDLLDRRTPLG